MTQSDRIAMHEDAGVFQPGPLQQQCHDCGFVHLLKAVGLQTLALTWGCNTHSALKQGRLGKF